MSIYIKIFINLNNIDIEEQNSIMMLKRTKNGIIYKNFF
jgi:hypothetical protein